MNHIEELGKFLISTTVFGGLIVWLLKSYFENYLKNDLEKYKYDLELQSFKQKTQFTKLHEESAETIKKIYLLLNEYSGSISSSISNIEGYKFDSVKLNVQINNIMKNANDFKDFFNQNKILLSEEICLRIEKLDSLLFESIQKVMIYKIYESSSEEEKLTKTLNELNTKMKKELPSLKIELEKEFRKILGVTN